MAEAIGAAGSGHPNLNLTAEEKRVYAQLLKEADPDGFGAVSGDVAVKFFERTKLPPDVLGQIWQIADTENRGFLTPAGFGIVLRLIGHAQAGRTPTTQIATQTAPLPRFDAVPGQQAPVPQPVPQQIPPPASPSHTGPPPIRVPALTPEKVGEYSTLFEKSGAENGILSGVVAKQIFERARLPNEVLGRIWALSDTQGRGALNVTEFTIAMHLLASYKSGAMRGVPTTLPPGLYEAAQRKPPARLGSSHGPGPAAIPFQPQGTGFSSIRPQSPLTRQQLGTPISAQSTGDGWAVAPADKARFDSIFATVDKQGRGFITGEQAVEFFGNARLPEEVLAQIWDLADINSEGQLNRDEFAVAMYLIRQQRGTKDGRGNLPPTLPPALVPPSMRKQYIPPSQPTAPAFENAPITKPRSAADDLFGLDAFGPPPLTAQTQISQSTGGTDAGPFANPSNQTSGPSSPTNMFKPFIPSSSFGQSLGIAPQSTGSPAPQQQRAIPSVSDDLLGDADPEVSSKLTNETSELGNLSNQVSGLSKQMTDLQGSRAQTEQDLSQTTAQKRAFESRLAQLRSLYEKEVKEVKALQEQLTASKNETKRLQQDMAMIDGSHQDLSVQHQQLRSAFEADQRENAALKEKMRQVNAETERLKPQLEKLKSDARQQKGLVAINKKQLATNEGERDRIKAEIAAAQKQIDDATREAEESNRQVETSKKELEEARNIPIPTMPSVKSPTVVSPAPSTSSNPFFRRSGDTAFSPPFSPPAAGQETPTDNRNAFDNIFGPSFGTSGAPPPSTSFRNESPAPVGNDSVPPISATSETSSAPPDGIEPPAPLQSNQITSAALPFRAPLSRGDSISSSVRVAPPASRLSPVETPRALTPSDSTPSPPGRKTTGDDPFGVAAPDEEQESIRQTLPTAVEENKLERTSSKGTDDQVAGIPGAFPEADTPRSATPTSSVAPAIAIGAGAATVAAGAGLAAATISNGDNDKGKAPEKPSEATEKEKDSNFDDIFGGPAHKRTPSEEAADFDAAFAGMKTSTSANGNTKAQNDEFPAIQEVGGDDDDDDDSSYSNPETPMGFEDDFNSKTLDKGKQPATEVPVSTSAPTQPVEVASAVPANLRVPRPGLVSKDSAASSLPPFDESATGPPDYKEAVPEDNPSHFPREYKGLLPEREDPTSPPPTVGGSSLPGVPSAGSPPLYGPEVGHARRQSDSHPPAPPPKTSPFDFDSAFAGVGPAQVEDDSEEDDDAFKPARNQPTEFDPTFDTPTQSRSNTSAANPGSFMGYNAVTNGSPQASTNGFQGLGLGSGTTTSGASGAAPSHDWDDIFAGMGSTTQTQPATSTIDPGFDFGDEVRSAGRASQDANTKFSVPPTTETTPTVDPVQSAPVDKPAPPERPQPGRALSETSTHDDPILKRLTAMGWNRQESLAALEKFDYNIDKAADYLTFRS